jgi:hypothetical protein
MECAGEIITVHGEVGLEILNERDYLTRPTADGLIIIKIYVK